MHKLPYVLCQNPGCGPRLPIRVPAPSLIETDTRPLRWPSEKLPISLVCPRCKHGHRHQKVKFGDFLKLPEALVNEPLWCIEIECVQDNCQSLARWYMPSSDCSDASDAREIFLTAGTGVVCEWGHSLANPASIVRSLQKVSEILPPIKYDRV